MQQILLDLTSRSSQPGMRGEHSPTDKHLEEKFSEDTQQEQSGLTVAGHRGGDIPYDSKIKEESTTPRERVPSGKSSMCKGPVTGGCMVSLRNKEDNRAGALGSEGEG